MPSKTSFQEYISLSYLCTRRIFISSYEKPRLRVTETRRSCACHTMYTHRGKILLRQKRNISLLKRFPRFMQGSKGSSLMDEEKSVIENG